jgi:hypothetical protein
MNAARIDMAFSPHNDFCSLYRLPDPYADSGTVHSPALPIG